VASAVIAVDFDNTITKNGYPEVGEEILGAVAALKFMKERLDCAIVLWTCRNAKTHLIDATYFCRQRGLDLDAINSNYEDMGDVCTPKIYADIYIDDCSAEWVAESGGGPYTPEKWRRVLEGVIKYLGVEVQKEEIDELFNS